jgi:hypothetical protein
VKPLHSSERVVIILKEAKSFLLQIISFCIKIYLKFFSIESIIMIIFCCILLDSLYQKNATQKKGSSKSSSNSWQKS